MLDFDGPDAHRCAAAVALWKQHTRVDGYRLSLHVPSLPLWCQTDRDSMRGKIRTGCEMGAATRPFCFLTDLSRLKFLRGLHRRDGRSSVARQDRSQGL